MAALENQQGWQKPFSECQQLIAGNLAFSDRLLPEQLSKHGGLRPVSLGAPGCPPAHPAPG